MREAAGEVTGVIIGGAVGRSAFRHLQWGYNFFLLSGVDIPNCVKSFYIYFYRFLALLSLFFFFPFFSFFFLCFLLW